MREQILIEGYSYEGMVEVEKIVHDYVAIYELVIKNNFVLEKENSIIQHIRVKTEKNKSQIDYNIKENGDIKPFKECNEILARLGEHKIN